MVETANAALTTPIVATLIRRGVSHVAWRFCSQVRAPVAPVAAAIAHAMHTRSVYLPQGVAHMWRCDLRLQPSLLGQEMAPHSLGLALHPGLARAQPLDDPPLRALNLIDLKADTRQIIQGLTEQMIGLEANREGLQ